MLGVVADHLASSASSSLALAHQLLALTPPVSLAALAGELEDWRRSQEGCTPAGVVPPPPGRRIAVLVAGVGSNDTHAAIDHVDTATLGYAPGDVVRFSYNGGRAAGQAPTPGGVAASLPTTSYGPADTETDLRPVADRLVALLARLAALAPGVPIDVIAHSQGGVVVHLALIQAHARGDLPAQLGTVVTISSPHQGTDLATGLAALKGTALGELALQALRPATSGTLDPDSTSLAQLSETSDVAQELRQRLPAGVHLLSIGASGDPVVPWVRTRTPGATSDLVPLGRVRHPLGPAGIASGHPRDRPGPRRHGPDLCGPGPGHRHGGDQSSGGPERGRARRRPDPGRRSVSGRGPGWPGGREPRAGPAAESQGWPGGREPRVGPAAESQGLARRREPRVGPAAESQGLARAGARPCDPRTPKMVSRPGWGRVRRDEPGPSPIPPGPSHGRPHGALGPGFA